MFSTGRWSLYRLNRGESARFPVVYWGCLAAMLLPAVVTLGLAHPAEAHINALEDAGMQPISPTGPQPEAQPDIFGPGAVLTVGNIRMKVTNVALLGNIFASSADPAGQWPGASSVEYLNFIAMGVGAVNPSLPIRWRSAG